MFFLHEIKEDLEFFEDIDHAHMTFLDRADAFGSCCYRAMMIQGFNPHFQSWSSNLDLIVYAEHALQSVFVLRPVCFPKDGCNLALFDEDSYDRVEFFRNRSEERNFHSVGDVGAIVTH